MITISKLDKNWLLVNAPDWNDQAIVRSGAHEWSASERCYVVPRIRIVDIVEQAKKDDMNHPQLLQEAKRLGPYPEDLYRLEKMSKVAYESTLACLRMFRQTGIRAEDLPYFQKHFRGKFPPYRHQLVTFAYIDQLERCAIYNEMGTGKTASVIWSIDWNLIQKKIYSALIIAPNNILGNWEREVQIHAPRLKTVIIQGTRNHRLDLLDTLADIYIINYEGLKVIKEELKDKFQMVVLDEAHRIKDPAAVQTKIIHELFTDVHYKVAMTGTPIGNNLIDLHQLMTWIDPFMFEPFYQFRSHWFYNVGYKWFPNRQNEGGKSTEKMMQEKVYTRAVRYRKDECLDLPPKTYIRRDCVLDPVQAVAYRQMMRAMMSAMEEGLISAKNVLSQLVKLSEITSGFIRDENGVDHVFKKCAKLDLLETIMEDEIGRGHKTVHWARYVPDIKRIGKMLENNDRKVLLLYGASTKKRSAYEIVEEFQNDPTVTDLVGNPAVGGLGLNMTAADYAVFYSNDYSWIKRSQAEDRIHRMGSEKHHQITIIDLVSQLVTNTWTVDKLVVDSLIGKKELAHTVIDVFKAGIADSFGLFQEKREADERLAAAVKNVNEVNSLIDFTSDVYRGATSLDEPECIECGSKDVLTRDGITTCRSCGYKE